jgi:hypothetical protein
MSVINTDPEVMRWIGGGLVGDEQQTMAAIETFERRWDQYGFGDLRPGVRATGELIGFTGLAVPEFLPEVMPAVEIGWRLGRAFWGRGLATEAAAAALRFGLIGRDLGQIIRITQVGDGASERIMASSACAWPGRRLIPPATARSGSTRSPRLSTWRQAQGQRRPHGQASRERAFWDGLGGVYFVGEQAGLHSGVLPHYPVDLIGIGIEDADAGCAAAITDGADDSLQAGQV